MNIPSFPQHTKIHPHSQHHGLDDIVLIQLMWTLRVLHFTLVIWFMPATKKTPVHWCSTYFTR